MPAAACRRLAALALLALVLPACRLGLAVDVDVRRDGSGTLGVVVSADEELLAAAAQEGVDPLGRLAEQLRDVRGWSVREESAGGDRAVRLEARFSDPAGFEALAADLADALAAPEVRLLSPLQLRLQDGKVFFEGEAGMRFTPEAEQAGVSRQRIVRELRRRDAVDYTVSVTFPGPVERAPNAVVDGSTATWRIAPGTRVTLDAVAPVPPPPLLTVLAGGVVGGAAAGVVLWLWARRRRRT